MLETHTYIWMATVGATMLDDDEEEEVDNQNSTNLRICVVALC